MGILGCLLVAAILVAACSSGTVNTSSGMGTVTTSLSDPATCQAPSGPYSHVWVTISDIQANVNSTAAATDSGWVDLSPSLKNAPKQIDLLGQANNQCFLATMGDNLQLQAGSYGQLRVILAANSPAVANSACGNANNCVMLTSDATNTPHTLNLSSESQTGNKIPPGQIAGGAFTIAAGQTKDLNIDFNTCCSIVQQGNGQYRLKPVLHAGEVSLTSTSINGTVLDKATGNPVAGTVMVSVEQKDAAGVDRIMMSTTAATNGTFVFCPLPLGSYDVVIVGARTSDGALYAPAIVTGVQVGSTVGSVQIAVPSGASATTATNSATLNGTVTSQNLSNAGTVADVQLSTLATIGTGTPVTYTIPLPPTSTQNSAVLGVETAASGTCPAGTDCATYSMTVPASGVNIGAWASTGATLTLNATWATYTADGIAFVPGGGNTVDCNPSEIQKALSTFTSVTVASPIAVPTMGFVQCQ